MPGVSAEGAAPLRDASRAWAYFRRHPGYGADWRAFAAVAAYEPAAFPLRVQREADLAAARWGLHAWEDPFADDGALAPFWAEAPVALAVVAPPDLPELGEPLGVLMARDGAQLAGLRLLGGALLLKVEWAGMAAQMRLVGAATLDPAADRLLLCRPYELALHARMTRMADVEAHLARALGKRRAGSGRRTTTPSCFPPWTGRLPGLTPAT